MTSARILVLFELIGVFLQAVMLFEPIKNFANAGITVPIIGFGASLARGAIEGVKQFGILGIFIDTLLIILSLRIFEKVLLKKSY